MLMMVRLVAVLWGMACVPSAGVIELIYAARSFSWVELNVAAVKPPIPFAVALVITPPASPPF